MVTVLGLIGYGPVESLQFFLSRFTEQCTAIEWSEELNNVWISHRSIQNLKRFQQSLYDDHFKMECKKVHSNPYTELDFVLKEKADSQFSSEKILNEILMKLHCCLAHYVLTECLVLYNWGINSFELVLDNVEFCMRLLKNQNNYKRKKVFESDEEYFRKWRMILTSQRKNVTQERLRGNSCDLFEEEERKLRRRNKRRMRKYPSYRELERIYGECDRPLREIRWGCGKGIDIFNKDRILYDMKERLWPTNHTLSASTSGELMNAILKVKVTKETNCGRGLSNDIGRDWKSLRRILGLILKNHKALMLFDGYGKLLKRHLKIAGFGTETAATRTLKPIPSKTVSSYIAIILHKVIPLEFFGTNRVRKKFFRETARVVSGGKIENFTLEPLIQMFLNVKNHLKWIREIQGWDVARSIISKIVKWLLLDYILLILKNHFYITDVSSSGYKLYYYRKSDVEGAVSGWVNKQIRMENLRVVNGDLDHWTSVERNWLETGKVELSGNVREIKMPESTEYINPVANVRFLPKTGENCDLRIITNYRIRKTTLREGDVERKKLVQLFMDRHVRRFLMFQKVKLLLRFLADKYGSGIKPLPNTAKVELAWMKAVHLREIYGKLYYVRADVSDAFGSVLPSLLGAIIDEKLRVECNQVVQLKKIKECRARNGRIDCCIRKSFSDKPMENSLLVSRSIFVGSRKKLPSYNSLKLKKILDQVIQHSYLRINGKRYKLLKGLTQGGAGSISSLLCEIYYSEMDRLYFEEFTACRECVLLRAVDDYLLLTSDFEKATKFYDIVYNGIKDFNVTFNMSKLKTNIKNESSYVNYLGLIFDVSNLTVRPDYTRYKTKDFLSTMKLSDSYNNMFFRRITFLRTRSMTICQLKLLPVTLNRLYNTVSVVREIVYAACIVQSGRILSLTRHLTLGNDKNDLDVCVILSKTLQKIATVVRRWNQDVTKIEICWLFWNAAFTVFRKYCGSFPALLTVIRHRVNVIERSAGKRGHCRLLDSMKREMLQGSSWRDLRKNLKIVTAKLKPSVRFQ